MTIKPLLLPILNNVIKAFNRSGFTKLLNRDREILSKHYNYGVQESGKGGETVHPTTDIWDAIKFECEIEMSDCAQRTIFY